MTDREMLEFAAKAAGNGAVWREWAVSRVGAFKSLVHEKRSGMKIGLIVWNPRDDDGDSFRLAVDLGINIKFNTVDNKVTVDCPDKYGVMGIIKEVDTDRRSITRQSVLYIAATIGKGMP